MRNLYITADKVGTVSGGGIVTRKESEALKALGNVTIIDRNIIDPGAAIHDPFELDLIAEQNVVSILKKGSVDIAHFYSGTFTNTIKRLKQSGTKITYTAAAHDRVISIQEFESFGVEYPHVHIKDDKLWEKYIEGYKLADIVICPSSHSLEIMYNYGCNCVTVIPHGIDPIKEIKKSPKIFKVGYFGQMGPDKGVIYLLRAWKQLNYKDSVLLIGGRDSEGVLDLIRICGGAGNIHIIGSVNEISDFYNECSIYVQPSVCLLPGSLVIANDLPKNIEDLDITDRVLAADGNFRSVIKPIKNQYNGTIVSVKTSGINIPTRMTENHRVLCIKRGLVTRVHNFDKKLQLYNTAMKLHNEQGLGSTKISRILGIKERAVASWLYYGSNPEGKGPNFSLKEEVLRSKPQWSYASELEKGDIVIFPRIKTSTKIIELNMPTRKYSRSSGKKAKTLPTTVVVDEPILKLIGYYISEGCGSDDSVAFCFNIKERNYTTEVINTVIDRFGLKAKEVKHKVKQSSTVWVYSVLFSEWLRSLCGKGAHLKHMPSWALDLPKDQLAMLLCGMWNGDGSIFMARGRAFATYSTVSKPLAHQVFMALVKLGFSPHLYDSGKRGYSVNLAGPQVDIFLRDIVKENIPNRPQKIIINQTYIDDDYYYTRITDIARLEYIGPVFNLEVEGNPSYAAPFVVHNSEGFGIEILEALEHGRPVIASLGAGGCDVISDGVDGFKIPIRSPNAIAEKIDWFRTRPESISAMSKDAVLKANNYKWEDIKKKYFQVWNKVLIGAENVYTTI